MFDNRASLRNRRHLTCFIHMLKRGVCIFVEQAGPIYKIRTERTT